MKRRNWILIVIMAVVLSFGTVMAIATTAAPGSAEDPVVTKSYVNSYLESQVKTQVEEAVPAAVDTAVDAALEDGIEELIQEKLEAALDEALENVSASGSSAEYEVLHLEAGQRLIAGASTEIILRSGEAVIIDNGYNGLADVTAGLDLMSTDTLQQNHLLISPRDDGRGVAALTEVYLMVRGSYTLQ